jgi:hypothetical protein
MVATGLGVVSIIVTVAEDPVGQDPDCSNAFIHAHCVTVKIMLSGPSEKTVSFNALTVMV